LTPPNQKLPAVEEIPATRCRAIGAYNFSRHFLAWPKQNFQAVPAPPSRSTHGLDRSLFVFDNTITFAPKFCSHQLFKERLLRQTAKHLPNGWI